MQGKYLGFVLGAAIGFETLLNPTIGDAFYVSQREMQKAGIKASQITKVKQPMGDTDSYKGTLEDNETFHDIADRIRRGAEDFCGTGLSEGISRKAVANFNSYRNIEMPSVGVPCKYQFMANYVRELENEMKRIGKSEPLERDLGFLRGKLQELEKLYEQDISGLKENYLEHEKRIEELEGMPWQKDYSEEIEELRGENRELRKMIEGMEKEYSQVGQEYSKQGNVPLEYAQPVQPPGTGGHESIVIGLPEWLPGIPYTYRILNGSIYCWGGFDWMYWGILEPYGLGFRGRRWDGRFFDYYGPRDFPYYGHHKPYRGFSDGRHWGARGKDFGVHPDPRHGRGEHRPDFHDRRFEAKPRNDGRNSVSHIRGQQALPQRHENSRLLPRGNLRGNPSGGHPNNQFNRQFNQPRGEFRGGLNAPQRGLGNPGGRGMPNRLQSRGRR